MPGFRLADADLAGYVVLDFGAFDAWYEEDEPNVGHPRDPFHRIDVLASSRHVRLELDGQVLAESSRPTLLFETMLPGPLLPAPRGHPGRAESPAARGRSAPTRGRRRTGRRRLGDRAVPDIAWTYENPLHDAAQVRGLIAFFDERIDVTLDGERHRAAGHPLVIPAGYLSEMVALTGEQLRTRGHDAPRAGPLTRPDTEFPRPCDGASVWSCALGAP